MFWLDEQSSPSPFYILLYILPVGIARAARLNRTALLN